MSVLRGNPVHYIRLCRKTKPLLQKKPPLPRWPVLMVPSRLEKIEDPNDANHLTFVAEPFENGYGHTLGNSLRRVLLGSLEGAAITSVRIAGAQHEFSSLPGVVEDVTEIVLNLKKVKFKHNGQGNRACSLCACISRRCDCCRYCRRHRLPGGQSRSNHLHSGSGHHVRMRIPGSRGRGFATGDENKVPDMPTA